MKNRAGLFRRELELFPAFCDEHRMYSELMPEMLDGVLLSVLERRWTPFSSSELAFSPRFLYNQEKRALKNI